MLCGSLVSEHPLRKGAILPIGIGKRPCDLRGGPAFLNADQVLAEIILQSHAVTAGAIRTLESAPPAFGSPAVAIAGVTFGPLRETHTRLPRGTLRGKPLKVEQEFQ